MLWLIDRTNRPAKYEIYESMRRTLPLRLFKSEHLGRVLVVEDGTARSLLTEFLRGTRATWCCVFYLHPSEPGIRH